MKALVKFKWVFVIIVLLAAASGCIVSGNQPPQIASMTVSVLNPEPGERIDITVNATDPENDQLTFNWSVQQGVIEVKPNQSSAVYEVPDTSGRYRIQVTVSDDTNSVAKDVTIVVVDSPLVATPEPPPEPATSPTGTAQTPTNTPAPADTPTASPVPATETPTPPPPSVSLECKHPAVIESLFPQLAGYSIFFHPQAGDYAACEGILHETYGDSPVVKLTYTDQQDPALFASFGISPLNDYDASAFGEICLLVYADQPLQPFWLKMKDMDGVERAVSRYTDATVGNWHELCEPIDSFAAEGVDVQHLENINLGFDTYLGSASFLIAKMELRP